MREVVIAYRKLQQNLGKVIDKSGYKNDYIAQRIGMKPTSFYVKKRRGNWNDDEMIKILDIVENEETENYLLGKIMEKEAKGEDGSFEELMDILKST